MTNPIQRNSQNLINFSATQSISAQGVTNTPSSISSCGCSSLCNKIQNWFQSIGRWFQKHWHAYQLNSAIKEGQRQIQSILETNRTGNFFQRFDFFHNFPQGNFKALIFFRGISPDRVLGAHFNVVDRNQLITSFREASLQKLEEAFRAADPSIFSKKVSVHLLVIDNLVNENGVWDVFHAQSGGGKVHHNLNQAHVAHLAREGFGPWINGQTRDQVQEFIMRPNP